MKTIKVSEATPLQLDWLVAKCEGKNGILHDDGITRCIVIAAASGVYKGTFKPTISWAQGGPIIDLEIDQISRLNSYPEYTANRFACDLWEDCEAVGPTMLIAAMRCCAASKLGEEVEVPDELI